MKRRQALRPSHCRWFRSGTRAGSAPSGRVHARAHRRVCEHDRRVSAGLRARHRRSEQERRCQGTQGPDDHRGFGRHAPSGNRDDAQARASRRRVRNRLAVHQRHHRADPARRAAPVPVVGIVEAPNVVNNAAFVFATGRAFPKPTSSLAPIGRSTASNAFTRSSATTPPVRRFYRLCANKRGLPAPTSMLP